MERGPSDKLSDRAILDALSALPEWKREGDKIVRTYVRKNFLDAVGFIQRIAQEAERMDHHPDILLHDYKNVKVLLTTHSAGGITQNDIDLARAIDTLP